jgi:hypothetical protein
MPPLSVTDTLARFTPALRIAEDFCAFAPANINVNKAAQKKVFFIFMIVRFKICYMLFKDAASFFHFSNM